jgi:hypothetical protein
MAVSLACLMGSQSIGRASAERHCLQADRRVSRKGQNSEATRFQSEAQALRIQVSEIMRQIDAVQGE